MTQDQPTQRGFEVYRDDSHIGVFAVLTNPGPSTPRGTLDVVQRATEERYVEGDAEVPNGHAGTVYYRPGKDDGEVRRVEFDTEEASP